MDEITPRRGMLALALTAVVAVAAGLGCGKERAPAPKSPAITMTAGQNNPAAQGKVLVTDAGNGNNELLVSVSHLAEPPRVASDATTYVVWVAPIAGDAPPQNVGALTVDQDLSGLLRTITPHDEFDLFITAEPSERAQSPSGERVLWTRVAAER